MPRAWESERREHPGADRPLHSICPGICNMITDCPNDSSDPLGQFYCILCLAQEDPLQPGEECRKEIDC